MDRRRGLDDAASPAPYPPGLSRRSAPSHYSACKWPSRPYTRPEKRAYEHSITTALRNRAIILLLLDAGMGASELCGLKIKDAELANKRIAAPGKSNKKRALPISAHTTQDHLARSDDRAQGGTGERAAVSWAATAHSETARRCSDCWCGWG